MDARLRRHVIVSISVAMLAVVPLGVSAAADGTASAAHQRQHGGYDHRYGTDGTTFKNVGECVSYAAHGGEPASAYLTIRFDVATFSTSICGTGLPPVRRSRCTTPSWMAHRCR